MSDLPTYDEAMGFAAAALRMTVDVGGVPFETVRAAAALSLAWTALARELREGAAKAEVPLTTHPTAHASWLRYFPKAEGGPCLRHEWEDESGGLCPSCARYAVAGASR